jgi:hypothetical protein
VFCASLPVSTEGVEPHHVSTCSYAKALGRRKIPLAARCFLSLHQGDAHNIRNGRPRHQVFHQNKASSHFGLMENIVGDPAGQVGSRERRLIDTFDCPGALLTVSYNEIWIGELDSIMPFALQNSGRTRLVIRTILTPMQFKVSS